MRATFLLIVLFGVCFYGFYKYRYYEYKLDIADQQFQKIKKATNEGLVNPKKVKYIVAEYYFLIEK